MKKRIVCLLMTITMMFSSVESAVFAEEANENMAGEQIVVDTEEVVETETEEVTEELDVLDTEVEVTTEEQSEVESEVEETQETEVVLGTEEINETEATESIDVDETTEMLEETEIKTENVYNLRTLFPDDALRFEVIRNIGDSSLNDDSDVTATQLEKVTYLFGVGSTRVTDLTGIEKLTKLEQINLVNHEIESIDSIKWSELQELRDLNLNGNNIKKMPDLTQNLKLEFIGLNGNMLSGEECKAIYEKLPSGDGVHVTFEDQRTKMVELVVEDNYYVTNSGISVFWDIKGKKDYVPKFYIDDVECKAERRGVYKIKNNELSYGSHKIRVELYNGKIKVAESEDYTFHIVDGESSFVERTYYTRGDDRYFDMMRVYFDTRKDIDKVNLVNSSGKIYATVSSEVSMWETEDPRYKKDNMVTWLESKVFCTEVSFDNVYNKLPVGLYNFEILYADGTKDIAKNALKVIEQQEGGYAVMKSHILYAVSGEEKSEELYAVEKSIRDEENHINELIDLSISSGSNSEKYEMAIKESSKKIGVLKEERERILIFLQNNESAKTELERLDKYLKENRAVVDEFDEAVIYRTIDCIRVTKDAKLIICIKGGIEITEDYYDYSEIKKIA